MSKTHLLQDSYSLRRPLLHPHVNLFHISRVSSYIAALCIITSYLEPSSCYIHVHLFKGQVRSLHILTPDIQSLGLCQDSYLKLKGPQNNPKEIMSQPTLPKAMSQCTYPNSKHQDISTKFSPLNLIVMPPFPLLQTTKLLFQLSNLLVLLVHFLLKR